MSIRHHPTCDKGQNIPRLESRIGVYACSRWADLCKYCSPESPRNIYNYYRCESVVLSSGFRPFQVHHIADDKVLMRCYF